jgi:hypothetical protein
VGARDRARPDGAMLIAAIGIAAVVAARSRAPARVPEQLLRMVLLAGLALWAVRASVWFGLALPVAICALARERPPRPAEADRGVPLASGPVLAALAVALAVVLPPVSRAIVPDVASRPELTAAPSAAAGWLAANPQPGRMFNFQPWGSYLEFRLGPKIQPAVDSRIELLPDGALARVPGHCGRTLGCRAVTGQVGHRLRGDRRAPDAVADRAPGRLRTLAAGVLPRRRTGVRPRGAATDG